MNDRYLFKAKRIDTGEWVQGFLFQLYVDGGFDWCIGNNPLLPNSFAELTEEDIDWFRVDESTICKCIGSKDKNGDLIFENDIVKDENERTWRIHYYIPFAMYMLNGIKHNGASNGMNTQIIKCEVIGNIFDNHELLESKE